MAEAALAAARAAGEPADASLALRAIGLVAWELGDVAAAAGLLRRAVEVGLSDGAAGERRAAEARRTLCWVLSDLGDTRAALREAALAAPHFGGRDRAVLLTQRAWVLQRAGRLEDALADYRRAAALLRRDPSELHEARLLGNRSLLLVQQGRLGAAEADLRRAEGLFRRLGRVRGGGQDAPQPRSAWPPGGATSPGPSGCSTRPRPSTRPSRCPGRSACSTTHRAEVLLAARLVPEARTVSERAVRRLGAAGARAERAEALLMVSKAAFLGERWNAAREAALEAERAFARQGRGVWRAEARLALARADWAAGDRSATTLRRARRAGAELRAAGLRGPALEAALIAGHAALAAGRVRVAAAELGHASRARRSGPAELRVRAWHAEAKLRLARGDRAGARRALAAGLRAVEQARTSLGATELRVHAAAEGRHLLRLGLRLAVERGRPGPVLSWAERWRAGAVWSRPARPPDDADLAADLDALRVVSSELAEAALAGRDTVPLVRRQAELEVSIRDRARRAPGRLDHARMAPTPAVADLAAALGERALLELVEVDGRLWGVAVHPGGARLAPLGAVAEVETELDALRFALRRLTPSRGAAASKLAAARSGEHAARRLDALLLEPVRREIGDRPLVVVPTPRLHALPWAALPSCAGRPVTAAPSAALWRRAAAFREAPEGRVVLVAGPGLPGADEEVARLVARYPAGRRLSGAAAAARAVATAMDGAGLVHIAAHGRFRADNPLFSSLRMADGPLIVHELERLDRAPRLVILSACDAGLCAAGAGEGLMGLSAAMLALGTATLVAGAGLVPDEAAPQVMLGLHERLRAGAAPAEALAAAQDAAGRDGGLAARAGFVCLGAG